MATGESLSRAGPENFFGQSVEAQSQTERVEKGEEWGPCGPVENGSQMLLGSAAEGVGIQPLVLGLSNKLGQ
ncbi:hypothetical protein Spa2297_34405 (plasmid) [Streptomyces parvulus]|uniref:Uncharacterized protein n=1 Tax=Streptomyces parvulus TaxID=146923 RepID=A0A191VB66_9ACTN|nr:hypothetical protein Spa2297_34405 [Streptomyces parvulus]